MKTYDSTAVAETAYYVDENFVRVVNNSGSYDFVYVKDEAGVAPFINNLEEFKGSSFDVNADAGEGATLGLGASLPYNTEKNIFEFSKSSIEVTTSPFLDLNPPIPLPASASITASETKVTPLFKFNFNPKLMTPASQKDKNQNKNQVPKSQPKQSVFKTILKKITGKK